MIKFDLIVIGAGPGGYEAAIKATRLGLKTALVENREVGGTCLNRGCIPTKALLKSSHTFSSGIKGNDMGIRFGQIELDYEKVLSYKDNTVVKIRAGIETLIKGNNISFYQGKAVIYKDNIIKIEIGIERNEGEIEKENSQTVLQADNILIATGSTPILPNIDGINNKDVVTSDELLSLNKLYNKLIIIGGGVIGVEFATIYQEFGCQVEIVEAMDRILSNMDKEISQTITLSLKKKGVKIHTGAKVTGIKKDKDLMVTFESTDKKSGVLLTEINGDGILVCVGRKGNTAGLFGNVAPDMDGDKVKVNERFETNIKGIYAIGDVIKGTQLAHVASAQGIVAVEHIAGVEPTVHLDTIPACIYTTPEVAWVGFNKDQAEDLGYNITIGKYPMNGNCMTMLSMDERSYVKVVSESLTGKILGAQIVCSRATDMIGEFSTLQQ
ncbi:MAG: hypothetical protein K0S61_4752 [Anaerocolumna sp.]|nr:hypothetical protein [Anaerocolumna sp.]